MRLRKVPETQGTNFSELSQQRKELRGLRRDLGEDNALWKEHGEKDLKTANEQAATFHIAGHQSLSGAKRVLRKERQTLEASALAPLDYKAVFAESGNEQVEETLEAYDKIAAKKALEGKLLLQNLNPQTTLATRVRNEAVLKDIHAGVEKEEAAYVKKPGLLQRQAELIRHKEELSEEGHLCITPTVQKQLETLEEKLRVGKPLFLYGPTGTGKTSIARFAAKRATGKDAFIVGCNPQMRESQVWGHKAVRATPDGGVNTVDVYGPLTRAMCEGTVVIFDEFNAMPLDQMAFLKNIFNKKVGDFVDVPGNGKIRVEPGFQMVFTANLKSAKNPERQELPPEIAREFTQNSLRIPYIPPHEAYTVILSRLMDKDASASLSDYDFNTTLKSLCQAMADIQQAYEIGTDNTRAEILEVKGANGKVPQLKKFVLTQGAIEDMLAAWKVERLLPRNARSFAEFLDRQLLIGLTFEEYSEADRMLAAKILASRGLLTTLEPSDLGMPTNVFAVNAIKGLRGKDAAKTVRENSSQMRRYSLCDLATLDPFEVQKAKAADRAAELIARKKAETTAAAAAKGFKVGEAPDPSSPDTKPEEPTPSGGASILDAIIGARRRREIPLPEALSILGSNLINPSDYKDAYGWDISPSQIPPIPFTKEVLEQAKARGSYLLLHLDTDPTTGKSLTIENLNSIVQPKLKAKGAGEFIVPQHLKDRKSDPTFTTEKPRAGWVLVEKEVIDGSLLQNYTQQTRLLREHVKTLKNLTPKEQAALDLCTDQWLADIELRANSNDENIWKPAAKELANHPLNQLFRNRACETFQTIATLFLTRNGHRHLEGKWDWGNSILVSGLLAFVGYFDSQGADLYDGDPGFVYASTGVVPSRRVSP